MSPRLIYVPIADSFFESSIMQEELAVRFVMLALIRLALRPGSNGVVDVDLRTFAGAINIPIDDVDRAIRRLMEPDPASGCADEDGRRIIPVDPAHPLRNWRLVNWLKYRAMVHDAHAAVRMRELRERRVATDVPDVPDVPHVPTKTKTNTKTNTKTREKREGAFAPPTLDEVRAYISEKGYHFSPERFHSVNASKGWTVGKSPMKDWQQACVTWELREPGQTISAPAPPPEKKPSRSWEELQDPPAWVSDVLHRIRAREPWEPEELAAVKRWEAGEDVEPPKAPEVPA